MPKTISIPSATATTRHACSHCNFTSDWYDTCCKHEWAAHFKSMSKEHIEVYPGAGDADFRWFPDKECFDAFDAAFCAVSQKWEGPGWYREFRYMDMYSGCDMGMTIGLEHVDDSISSQWITTDVRRELDNIDIRFGDAMPEAGEVGEDMEIWCRHTARIAHDSIDILYATPLHKNIHPDLVYKAWRLWMRER